MGEPLLNDELLVSKTGKLTHFLTKDFQCCKLLHSIDPGFVIEFMDE
jgi:hypothetical protein